jgi:tRNA A-37 threonylcarbamoyl transferase component Bud32
MTLTAAAVRLDKKCGKSGIPDNRKCGKKTSPSTITKVALGAGAVAGVAGLALFARRRWGRRDPNWKGFSAPGEDWDRIEAEARKGGKKWDVFEDNKRDKRIACAAVKVDSWIREDTFTPSPRCLLAQGAYGNYVVHPSKKYGVKYLHNEGDEPTAAFRANRESLLPEGEMLRYANANGVPSPRLYKATEATLVTEHLDGYKQLLKQKWADGNSFFNLHPSAPYAVKQKMLGMYRTLHMAGITHNDAHLKNILYNPKTKDMKLIDFGLAEFATEDPTSFIVEMYETPRRIGMHGFEAGNFISRWRDKEINIIQLLSNYDTDIADKIVNGYYRSLAIALAKDSNQPLRTLAKRRP